MSPKGTKNVSMIDARSFRRIEKSFRRRTRIGFMGLLAEHAAGQLQEERLKGGALACEELLGKGVPLGEQVEGAHRVTRPRAEPVDSVHRLDLAVWRQVGGEGPGRVRCRKADLLVEGKLLQELLD